MISAGDRAFAKRRKASVIVLWLHLQTPQSEAPLDIVKTTIDSSPKLLQSIPRTSIFLSTRLFYRGPSILGYERPISRNTKSTNSAPLYLSIPTFQSSPIPTSSSPPTDSHVLNRIDANNVPPKVWGSIWPYTCWHRPYSNRVEGSGLGLLIRGQSQQPAASKRPNLLAGTNSELYTTQR